MDKTIFILGAGMSAECGAPVIRTFLLPEFLEFVPSDRREVIRQFLNSDYFSAESVTIEGALTKIDTEICEGATSTGYTIEQLTTIRSILVNYIIEVLSVCGDNLMKELQTTQIDQPYYVLSSKEKNQEHLFKDKITQQLSRELEHFSGNGGDVPIIGINAKKWLETYGSVLLLMKPNDVVINLNFDQFFELALLDLPLDVIVDYGLDYFELSPDEDVLCHGILPKVSRPPKSSEMRKITLLKIHGSLNWGICSECKSLMTTVRTPIIRVNDYIKKLQKGRKQFKERELCCEQFAVEPLIVIPKLYSRRGYENNYLKETSETAITEISNAENVVFFGYSLSESDLYVRNLFEKAKSIRKNRSWKNVLVINRSIASIKENYEGIFENVEFIETTSSKYIQDELKKIVPKNLTLENCILKNKPIQEFKL